MRQPSRVYLAKLRASMLLVCAWTCAYSADRSFAIAGGFGFDWLAPESARCVRIGASEAKQFEHCEFHASGAFGLPLAYHSCTKLPRGEVLVFQTAAHCNEALETMRANAP